MELMKFTWFKCELCGWSVKCPNCDNNCCNAHYGTNKDGTNCTICPLAYDHQSKGWDLFHKLNINSETANNVDFLEQLGNVEIKY